MFCLVGIEMLFLEWVVGQEGRRTNGGLFYVSFFGRHSRRWVDPAFLPAWKLVETRK
jgi:hypothetical protein